MTPLKTLSAFAFAGAMTLAAVPSAQAYTIYFDDEASGNVLIPSLNDDGEPTKKADEFELKKMRVWVFRKPEDYQAMIKAIKKSERMINTWSQVGFGAIDMAAGVYGAVAGAAMGVAVAGVTGGAATVAVPLLTAGGVAAGTAAVTVATTVIQKTIDPAKMIARAVKHDIEDKYTLNYGNLVPGGVISERVKEKREKVHIVITAKGEKDVPLLSFSMMNTDSAGIAVNKDSTGKLVVSLLSHQYEPVFEGSYTKEEWKQLPEKTRDQIKKAEKEYVKAAKQAFKQAKKA